MTVLSHLSHRKLLHKFQKKSRDKNQPRAVSVLCVQGNHSNTMYVPCMHIYFWLLSCRTQCKSVIITKALKILFGVYSSDQLLNILQVHHIFSNVVPSWHKKNQQQILSSIEKNTISTNFFRSDICLCCKMLLKCSASVAVTVRCSLWTRDLAEWCTLTLKSVIVWM